jgi:hypothetical protein
MHLDQIVLGSAQHFIPIFDFLQSVVVDFVAAWTWTVGVLAHVSDCGSAGPALLAGLPALIHHPIPLLAVLELRLRRGGLEQLSKEQASYG